MTVVEKQGDNKFKVIENIPTQKGARTIALDNQSHQLYLPTAEFGPPPEPTIDNPKPRPAIKPNTFVILVIEMVY